MAVWGEYHPVLIPLLIVTFTQFICAEVLTPPYFNLAQGREITATSTCGETPAGRELYCRLTGATGRERTSGITELGLIQGQYCDFCDRNDPTKEHPVRFAIDGTERWWQSPPLSRGMSYNAVNLTINLGQEFHVAYVFIKMANSPRPGVWALERSVDNGQTWKAWQYFADTPSDCNKFFSMDADRTLFADDTVICTTQFSKIVPLVNGEIVVSLVNSRPNALNFSYAETLQHWTKATNVRMRLLRTKTLLGHLMAVARQDPTTTRRYYYSIKDISLGGRCVCNGHAESCVRSDPIHPNKLVCQCEHSTCGDQCNECCPNAIQKKWQPGRADKIFQCESCQCYSHSDECVYDAQVDSLGQSIDIYGKYIGGGVCQNCRHNTTGVNCNECVPGYYNPYGVPLDSPEACVSCVCEGKKYTKECEAGTGRCLCSEEYTGIYCDSCSFGYYDYPDCKPCDCHLNGTEGTVCTMRGGQCPCKEEYVGASCDMCAYGFYNFPECEPCQCDATGSTSTTMCDVDTGQCPCRPNYSGLECDQCADGFYNYPECRVCDCVVAGTKEGICEKDMGVCDCKENYQYPRCDRCAPEYYGFPLCQECQCTDPGAYGKVCREDGQCACYTNFAGRQCSRCAAGFYRYPECTSCQCDLYGAIGHSCDQLTGQCECEPTFEGLVCSKCKDGFYNYPNCEECNCNPAGAKEVPGYPLGGCGVVTRGLLCECKDQVMGRICDQCKPGYYNLNRNNPHGCQACECHAPGTVSGLSNCDPMTGQCMCKTTAGGRRCDTCQEGFFGLSDENPFGCVECNCDMGGSVTPVCDRRTGQCRCKPRVRGVRCERPDTMHFFPSLQQLIYEIEDGITPEGSNIRYGFDPEIFANFSWRGYAILTHIQPEVLIDITIMRPSLYRVLYRFENLNVYTVKGEVTLTPQSVANAKQTSEVLFIPSEAPAFVTVGSTSGVKDFVLNPGRWTISIKSPELLLLDYMVLVPQAYYEATVLQQTVTRPCTVPNDQGPCLDYNYPDLTGFPAVSGVDGYVIDASGNKTQTQLFTDQVILTELDLPGLAKLDGDQAVLNVDLVAPVPGEYIIVVNYFALSNTTQDLNVTIRTQDGVSLGTVSLSNCKYSVLCREVLKDLNNMPSLVFMNGTAIITLTGDNNVDVAIGSVVGIPYTDWTLGYIRPSIICIRINGICIGSHFTVPADSRRIEFEDPPNQHLRLPYNEIPGWIIDGASGLVLLNNTVNTIEVEATIPKPDRYVFVVHFYLPTEAGIDLPVSVHADGQVFKGVFRPRYCPGVSGCRGLIYFESQDGSNILGLSDDGVHIRLNNTSGRDIYLDYMLMIPATRFSAADLDVQPVDNSANFLANCVGSGFQLISDSEFCRQGIFSLTTDFNNGAVPCSCNLEGSTSFSCVNFGGQCQCREKVIGRRCTHCEEGYYGFPDCTACNCPFGTCHPLTGECVCPPRVAGERCDECIAETYGYDPLVGCTDCDCNPHGVRNNDLDCEQSSGQCTCKDNVEGRKCGYCHIGHYAFPYCQECNCNSIGTQQSICNDTNGACLCKVNVAAGTCDRCVPGTFNLDPRNPKGCTSCFCFGTTQTCDSSTLYWSLHKDMTDWQATNVDASAVLASANMVAVSSVQDVIDDPDTVVYWVAPSAYLGNKVASYGGALKYSFMYELEDPTQEEEVDGPAVILMGRNMTIVHMLDAAYYEGNHVYEVIVPLVETHFVYSDTLTFVNRDNFMSVLVDLSSMAIRSSFTANVSEIRLMNASMSIAKVDGMYGPALPVEQCFCPPGYAGTSCESCSQGYYRAQTSPFLGTCVPCMCNRHTDTCDPVTGLCLGCQDNTIGDHCDACRPGHYGDPAFGVCTICSCPLPVATNNFASGCNVHNGQMVSCDCELGYSGLVCDRCAPGYHGNPNEELGRCEMCQCSDNIDMTDRGSCSENTGACLICDNNSTGANCSQCRDWWHGDAVTAKDCQPCTCDQCGAQECDNQVGQCHCKPNVEGDNCDACAPNSYNFESCEGCSDCNCGLASTSLQCNLTTGQCPCQLGVRGRMCDHCVEGYYDYTSDGCSLCDCEYDGAVTCDPTNGVCQCLEGVTGDRCDRCLPRWILVANEGCRPCDNCVHILLDDMEFMDRNMTSLSGNLETVSVGVTAMKRLQAINESIVMYWPEIDAIKDVDHTLTMTPLQHNVSEITQLADDTVAKADSEVVSADIMNEEASKFLSDALDLESAAEASSKSAGAAVFEVEDVLETILRGIEVTNIFDYIQQSSADLEDIMSVNLTGIVARADQAITDMFMLDSSMTSNREANKEEEADVQRLENAISDLSRSLYSLHEYRSTSVVNSSDAMALVDKMRRLVLNIIDLRLKGIENSSKDTEMILKMSRHELATAFKDVETCKADTAKVEDQRSSLTKGIDELADLDQELDLDLEDLDEKLKEVMAHSDDLGEQAKLLESVYTDTRDTAANALGAANAYQVIVSAINDSYLASDAAVGVANSALGKSFGVGDIAAASRNKSVELLIRAQEKLDETDKDLQDRLEDATTSTDQVEDMGRDAKDRLDDVTYQQDSLKTGNVGQRARDAALMADKASQQTTDAENKVNDIIAKLPEDKVKVQKLFNDFTKTTKNTQYAEQQTMDVKEKVPQIMELIDLVGAQSRNVRGLRDSVMANITELRKKIELARDEANRIRVGMEFLGNTSVALRNPPDLDLAGSYSRLTTYIRTQQSDALLAYIGPEYMPGRTIDYLSLELRDGQVVFMFDLGTGPAEITHPWTVSDNQWYKVIAERVGKTGTLTLERDIGAVGVEADTRSGNSSGVFTVLALNPVTAKFYLGGVPSTTMLPGDIQTRDFYEGVMEGVAFDSQPMGIWNFVYGESNYVGATERNVLREEKSNGFSFNGKGYVILGVKETNFQPQQKATIILRFKTYSSNGLLFFIGKGRDFSSIELRDGKVFFQYDLGDMPAKLMTEKTYNDGEWHKIQAARSKQTGFLRVDDEVGVDRSSPGSLTSLSYTDDIFIGGFNEAEMPVSYVRPIGFRGCIEDVQLKNTIWDLINNKEAKGVVRGCPQQILRTATFAAGVPGHIAIPMDSVGVNFEVTFRMKSTSNSSLLMYTSNNDQSTVFSVAMSYGKMIVTADPGGDLTRMETLVNTYNDGNWHYISIMKVGRKLILNIDDKDIFENPTQSLVEELVTQRPIYFGGTDFSVPESSVGATAPFFGCVSDITINGNFKNFASIPSQNFKAVGLGDCAATPAPVVLPDVTGKPGPGEETTDQPSVSQCALSANVDLSPSPGAISGKRFGSFVESREEYAFTPTSLTIRFTMTVEFKTTSTTGMIFYASDIRHKDFAGLYMMNGTVVAAFNCGTGIGRMQSTKTYNDGAWHKIMFVKVRKKGTLMVDEVKEGSVLSDGFAGSLNERPPYYFGGLPEAASKLATKNLGGASTSFQGCLRNLLVNEKTFGTPQLEFQVQPCASNIEQGSFFHTDGGYIQLTEDKFIVGLDLEFSIEIRPRHLTGVILSVHSASRDFMALQMKDGKIIFSADNGRGTFTSTYTPNTDAYLCDGQWHKIEAVKAKSTLLLTVDGVMVQPVNGKAGSSQTDTTEPLYIGGVPDLKRRGLVADENFLGCIRNLAIGINRIPYYFTSGTVFGSVKVDSCPAN